MDKHEAEKDGEHEEVTCDRECDRSEVASNEEQQTVILPLCLCLLPLSSHPLSLSPHPLLSRFLIVFLVSTFIASLAFLSRRYLRRLAG